MKKLLLLSFTIITSFFSISAQECAYESYNYWIGRAYTDFEQNNFIEAKKNIKTAFTKTDFPMGYDLNLGLRMAILTKDTLWAESLAIDLAKGGIHLDFFDHLADMPWHDKFTSDYPRHQDYYSQNYNLKLRTHLIDLRVRDSIIVDRYHSWRRGEIEMSLDELIADATEISDGFKQLIRDHGFPCEQNMGYYYSEGGVRTFPVNILLIHIYQRGELLFKDNLHDIVCDGKLTPMQHTSLNGFKGFGDSSGIEQEAKIRYQKYRPQK